MVIGQRYRRRALQLDPDFGFFLQLMPKLLVVISNNITRITTDNTAAECVIGRQQRFLSIQQNKTFGQVVEDNP
jgi:hypothetical protein